MNDLNFIREDKETNAEFIERMINYMEEKGINEDDVLIKDFNLIIIKENDSNK